MTFVGKSSSLPIVISQLYCENREPQYALQYPAPSPSHHLLPPIPSQWSRAGWRMSPAMARQQFQHSFFTLALKSHWGKVSPPLPCSWFCGCTNTSVVIRIRHTGFLKIYQQHSSLKRIIGFPTPDWDSWIFGRRGWLGGGNLRGGSNNMSLTLPSEAAVFPPRKLISAVGKSVILTEEFQAQTWNWWLRDERCSKTLCRTHNRMYLRH